MELALAPVDVGTVVEHCVGLMRERATEQEPPARPRTCPPDIGPVNADELRLKQILLNLLSNAVKFTPAGGTVTGVGAPGRRRRPRAGRRLRRRHPGGRPGPHLRLLPAGRPVREPGRGHRARPDAVQADRRAARRARSGSRASRGHGSTFSVRLPARRRAGREPAAVDPTQSGGPDRRGRPELGGPAARLPRPTAATTSSSTGPAPRGWLRYAGSSRTPSCSTSSSRGWTAGSSWPRSRQPRRPLASRWSSCRCWTSRRPRSAPGRGGVPREAGQPGRRAVGAGECASRSALLRTTGRPGHDRDPGPRRGGQRPQPQAGAGRPGACRLRGGRGAVRRSRGSRSPARHRLTWC